MRVVMAVLVGLSVQCSSSRDTPATTSKDASASGDEPSAPTAPVHAGRAPGRRTAAGVATGTGPAPGMGGRPVAPPPDVQITFRIKKTSNDYLPEIAKRVFRVALSGGVRTCYLAARRNAPKLAGTVKFRVRLDGAGGASQAAVEGLPKSMTLCIRDAMIAARFLGSKTASEIEGSITLRVDPPKP